MSSALKAAVTGKPQHETSPYERFRSRLEQIKHELRPLLGSDDAVTRFIRVTLNAVQAKPELLEADQRSMLLSCMKAAQDGLLPDGREAVLNVYNTKVKTDGREEWVKKVQYLPMVNGLIKKLYDSGQVTFVDAVAVYEKDSFEYRRGDDPKIEHVPYGGDDEPGPVKASYLIAKLKNGEIKREVLFRRDIEKIRAASKTPNAGPWVDWYDQQAIKSVIKRAYKQLPSAIEFEKVMQSDNEVSGFQFGSQTFAEHPTALEDMRGQGMTVPADIPQTDNVPAEAVQEEPKKKAAQPETTFSAVRALMESAKNAAAFDMARDLIREVRDETERNKLQEIANILAPQFDVPQ